MVSYKCKIRDLYVENNLTSSLTFSNSPPLSRKTDTLSIRRLKDKLRLATASDSRCPGRLTHGLYFRTVPQASLSLHKPMREPETFPRRHDSPALASPFKTTPPNTARPGSPAEAPLLKFKTAAPLRSLFRPLIRDPFPLRGRPAQTLRCTHGF
jgi:hypothetical protein